MRLQEEFLRRGRFAPWHRLRGWLLVLHCAADCPWRRRYARNCPRPLRIDSIGVRVRPRGQFAAVCHLAIVSAASLRFRRQHPRLVTLVETERTRRHWRHSAVLKSAGRSLSAYSHSMALVLPSSHSSCTQFSVPSRAECRQVTPCRVSSALIFVFVPKGAAGRLWRLDIDENARFETQPSFRAQAASNNHK